MHSLYTLTVKAAIARTIELIGIPFAQNVPQEMTI